MSADTSDTIQGLLDRVEELERWRAEFLETEWSRVASSLRGLDGWLADQPPLLNLSDVVDTVVVALGGRLPSSDDR